MKVHILLLVILLILNILPERIVRDRTKYILPLSFLFIFLYWAFRYDYGLDYWIYYDMFYSEVSENAGRGWGEKGYFFFSSLFSKYYQVIIAHSAIVVLTLFHMVRKYVPSNCYWFFFLILFIVPGLHFGMISALRNALAACIMYWAFDLCYITKRRWLVFYIFVLLAAMFHTSALAFVLFPIVHYFFSYVKGIIIFWILVFINIASLFFVNYIFNQVISFSTLTETYISYDEMATESNFNGILVKSLLLFPAFYMSKAYDNYRDIEEYKTIFICAFLYLSIYFFGFDWGGRFTLYLYVFFIIAMAITYEYYKPIRLIYMTPYFLFLFYEISRYYLRLANELHGRYSEGNYLFYHTILEANPLP